MREAAINACKLYELLYKDGSIPCGMRVTADDTIIMSFEKNGNKVSVEVGGTVYGFFTDYINGDNLTVVNAMECEFNEVPPDLKSALMRMSTHDKTCNSCKFLNENPRCKTGVPCNEWMLSRIYAKNK